MGVITTENIDAGALFGPIPPRLTIADPILLIGHMTSDNTPDLHTVKINVNRHSDVSGLIEWIPYIRAARNSDEQNLEAILVDSQLYYRSTKRVSMGSELLIWYTPELARMVGVPDIHPAFITNDDVYTCPYCCKEFIYPFSLRAHMRFKCEQNPLLPKPKQFNNTSPPLKFDSAGIISKNKEGFLENNVSPKNSSSGSSGSEQSPPSSPVHRGEKRKRNDSDSSDALNLVKREAFETVANSPTEQLSQSLSPDRQSNVSFEDTSGLDKTQNSSFDRQESVSAFHKVEKTSPLSSQHATGSLPIFGQHFVRPLMSSSTPQIRYTSQVPAHFPANLHDMQMSIAMRQAAKENIPQTIAPLNGLPLKNREDLRNLINCGKLPFHPDWRFHFPYMKSQNPIVDNLLTSAATFSLPAPLTQNWCAKCNATFRMTSDLVYHMRSHHKEEFQKTKSKPQEKLRCDVCGDRFKERHHLTRHMTSHQET